jgi:hypothetical protein
MRNAAQLKVDAMPVVEALRESLRDADEAALRAMREAAFHMDRGRGIASRLHELAAGPIAMAKRRAVTRRGAASLVTSP